MAVRLAPAPRRRRQAELPQTAAQPRSEPRGTQTAAEHPPCDSPQPQLPLPEYIPHESLCATRAEDVLSQAAQWAQSPAEGPRNPAGRQTSMLLRNACERLFTPAEERTGFFLLNALKYHAAALSRREALGTSGRRLFAELQVAAAQVHERILRANLRLALAIVKRFASDSNHFDELLSDATLVLVRAIEKFDFSRGFRFSTYATHAVQRALFRSLSRRQRLLKRQHVECQEILNAVPDRGPADLDGELHAQALRELLPQFVATLDPRERLIIQARYLNPPAGAPPTLLTLAQQMGVCKERARQLEQRAFGKLRRLFGPLAAAAQA